MTVNIIAAIHFAASPRIVKKLTGFLAKIGHFNPASRMELLDGQTGSRHAV
jgi:hypothetical protein